MHGTNPTSALSPTSRKTQARIIDAVVDTVWQQGLSGTTLSNVALAAGVSQGSLVFHFGSKQGLLEATLRRLTTDYMDIWRPALTLADPKARIRALIGADFHPEICSTKLLALWFSFWGEAAPHPVYVEICDRPDAERRRAMEAAFGDYLTDSRHPDPQLLAQSVDAMTNGLWLQMHLSAGKLLPEAAMAQAMAHFDLLAPS